MFASKIFLSCILLVSYVTTFQEIRENTNQLETEKTVETQSDVKDHLKVQFPNATNKIQTAQNSNSSDNSDSESMESSEDDGPMDVLSKEELREFRGLVASIQELAVYEGVYHPAGYGNPGLHRRTKRSTDSLVTNLNKIVGNLEKMVKIDSDDEKQKYFDQAVRNLDDYIDEVKRSKNAGKNSTIQIMKLENTLIVQCAGWLWYPIVRLNKTITCSDGIMRFEPVDKTIARACSLFSCQDMAL